jgi:hypothetical protein
MTGWQPIATAPKDGTKFLAALCVTNIHAGNSWWEMHVIWPDDETGEVHSDCEQGWSRIDDYSHWMQLPEAPETGK